MASLGSQLEEDKSPAGGATGALAHKSIFAVGLGGKKTVVAGVHLLPLPGSPAYDRAAGMRAIVARARRDVGILTEYGVDAILFANEADTPYEVSLGPETVASFAYAVAESTQALEIPFGINALLDAGAGIAIAHATGGTFVRGYFTGVYATDSGYMASRGADVLRLRSNLGAGDIRVFHNLVCVFGANVAPRPISIEAHGAVVHGRVDGLTISGEGGIPPALDLFQQVRDAAPRVPLLAGTSVDASNVKAIFEVADGAIVVSSLRVDGERLNPVDPDRVRVFMQGARAAGA